MQDLTAVLPTRALLPHDLALLLAPVRTEASSAPDAYAGRAEGVLVDERARVVAFIVRLAQHLDARGMRTLVPATAVTVMEGPILRIAWTDGQLCAQPRLDERPDEPASPPQSERRPVAAGEVPPGPGGNGGEAAKEGVEGAVLGAALGAAAGLVLGGPIAAASLAVFFAVGGSLGGAIAGAAKDAKPEASGTPSPLEPEHRGTSTEIAELEQRLRDPDLEAQGLVTTLRLAPVETTTEAIPPRAREAGSQG